jgi:hypothetical protein
VGIDVEDVGSFDEDEDDNDSLLEETFSSMQALKRN